MPIVELPKSLIERFEASSFCPDDGIKGRPETGTCWNTLDVECDADGTGYPTTSMFYVCHWNGEVTRAERPWGEMSGTKDGVFVKEVIEWFQSMTQAGREDQS